MYAELRTNGWRRPSSGVVKPSLLEHLQNLADSLDYFVAVVEAGGLDALGAYADQVDGTLQADTSLPEQLRIHAAQVVQHLRWCIAEYDRVGDFILHDAVERLAATVVRVAASSSEENRSKMWGPVMTNFVWPFAMNVIAAIPA